MNLSKQDTKREISFFNNLNVNDYNTMSSETQSLIYSTIDRYRIKGLVLEAGCGTGALGKRLIKINHNISVIGVDINRNFIKQIQKTNIANYQAVVGNLENNKMFDKEKFDCIIFPYILHHFPVINNVINNALFWLKKGGVIIIIDPNGSNLILKISYLLRVFLYKIFPDKISKYASLNEKTIPIDTFYNSLKKFKIFSISSFIVIPNRKAPRDFFGMLSVIRFILLKFYYFLPFGKYRGSDIIIIAKKE